MAHTGGVCEQTGIYVSRCGCGRAVLLLSGDEIPPCSLCNARVGWTMVWTMIDGARLEGRSTGDARGTLWRDVFRTLPRNAVRTVCRAFAGRHLGPSD